MFLLPVNALVKRLTLLMTWGWLGCSWLGCGWLASTLAGDPIPGIGPVGPTVKVAGNFQFTEGPAYDGARYLYFSDIPANRILRWDTTHPSQVPEVFLEPSGMCNGLMLDGQGHLLGCRMEFGEVVAFDLKSKQPLPLATQHQGKRFNATNDLVIDKTGGVYFTDPRYRAPEPWPQGKEAIYYRTPQGAITRLDDSFIAPNGIILSPDESRLYVIPSLEATMYVFDILEPGRLGPRRPFCQLDQPSGQSGKGGDGLTIDDQGNLYITSALGLQVFSPQGQRLGIIDVPEQPANVTFGGPQNATLYVTARTSLYAIPTSAKGHRFQGPVPIAVSR
jgi:gluconolactonase